MDMFKTLGDSYLPSHMPLESCFHMKSRDKKAKFLLFNKIYEHQTYQSGDSRGAYLSHKSYI